MCLFITWRGRTAKFYENQPHEHEHTFSDKALSPQGFWPNME